MKKIASWKLVILFIYSCTASSVFMFFLSLGMQWLLTPGMNNHFWGGESLRIGLNMAIIGVVLGVVMWLCYYIPYKKRQ